MSFCHTDFQRIFNQLTVNKKWLRFEKKLFMNFVEEISFFSMRNANLMIPTNVYSFKFPTNFVMVAFVAFLSDFAKTQGNACIRIFLHFFYVFANSFHLFILFWCFPFQLKSFSITNS